MTDQSQQTIIVGEVRDYDFKGKKLFSNNHLSMLNKAVLRHRNNRRTSFFWLPRIQDTSIRLNKWAMDAIYLEEAEIISTNGWSMGDEIRGPIVIKRSELLMPYIDISRRAPGDEERLDMAQTMMQGFWSIVENPLNRDRVLFAEKVSDLMKGRMLFGIT